MSNVQIGIWLDKGSRLWTVSENHINGQFHVNVFIQVTTSGIVYGIRNTTSVRSTSGQLKLFESSHIKRRYMFKLSEVFGQRSGSDAFGRRAVKNIGTWKDIGQTFAETGTTGTYPSVESNKVNCGHVTFLLITCHRIKIYLPK